MASKPVSEARVAKLEKKVAAIVELLRLNGKSIPPELE
jgi:hypothetical protein